MAKVGARIDPGGSEHLLYSRRRVRQETPPIALYSTVRNSTPHESGMEINPVDENLTVDKIPHYCII